VIDATQAWFWTPEWQESIRRSAEQVATGEAKVFEDDEAFVAALDAE